MSSRRGNGNLSATGADNQQLSQGVAVVSLDAQDDGGEWEVYARKSKSKTGSSAGKTWSSQNTNSRTWVGHQDMSQRHGNRSAGGSARAPANNWATQTADSRRPAGRGVARFPSSNRVPEQSYMAPQPVIAAPLEHGWNWQARTGSSQSKSSTANQAGVTLPPYLNAEDEIEADKDGDDENLEDDDSDVLDDSDDDLMSDDFDSDVGQMSHEDRKKNRWFKKFFDILASLTDDEINELERQWHCPACRGGPGAIDWYRGLLPLMTHAKTIGAKRVKLHREFAEVLEAELKIRGTQLIPYEAFGKWKGLKDEEKDYEIVWPPMVIVMNTRLEKDDNDKWIGMGNQELLDYFHNYAAVRARHSYGPQGHRGLSVLIFEASPTGFYEAECLHKHFVEQGTDRTAWECRPKLYHHGGKRQLYGFMALKEDLDNFNQHSQGKSKLKFEMRSHHEMVYSQLRQMNEDNQQLNWYKNKASEEKRQKQALEESVVTLSKQLWKVTEESRIVRQRNKDHFEQNKEEMDYQEQFFKNQIALIHEKTAAKEEEFEQQQQEKREKVKQANSHSHDAEDKRCRLAEIEKFIQSQTAEIEEFLVKRDELTKEHEVKVAAMKRRHWEEKLDLEEEFDAGMSALLETYTTKSTVSNGS